MQLTINNMMPLIAAEMERAVAKFPSWPLDAIHAAGVVNEESGELMRAAVQFNYEGGSIEEAKKEAVQTIVSAIRFLMAIDVYTPQPSIQMRQTDILHVQRPKWEIKTK